MKASNQQKTLSSPSPTSTAPEATTKYSLPKDYKKIVQYIIHRPDISPEVKIDLWKRFTEYEACVDEENHKNNEEEPVFTATNGTSVGEVGADVEMPVPWMESESGSSDDGGWEYTGENSDSGYGGSGSNSVDGGENAEGEDVMDGVVPVEGEEKRNAAGQSVEEEIDTTMGEDGGQGRDDNDNTNADGNGDGNHSLDASAPNPEATSTSNTTIPANINNNKETDTITITITTTHSTQATP
ncbi:hypothetical protein V491_06484, partial [Pseudogymnoascus sp. VKM F-3775]